MLMFIPNLALLVLASVWMPPLHIIICTADSSSPGLEQGVNSIDNHLYLCIIVLIPIALPVCGLKIHVHDTAAVPPP